MIKLFRDFLGKPKNRKKLAELFKETHVLGTMDVEAIDVKEFTSFVKGFMKTNGYDFSKVRERDVFVCDSYTKKGLVYDASWYVIKVDDGAIAVKIQGSNVLAVSLGDFESFRAVAKFRIYTEEDGMVSKFFLCKLHRGRVLVVGKYIERSDADGDFYTNRENDEMIPFYLN